MFSHCLYRITPTRAGFSIESAPEEDMREVMLTDPAIKAGVLHAELFPFAVALASKLTLPTWSEVLSPYSKNSSHNSERSSDGMRCHRMVRMTPSSAQRLLLQMKNPVCLETFCHIQTTRLHDLISNGDARRGKLRSQPGFQGGGSQCA